MDGALSWQPPKLLQSTTSANGKLMSPLRREMAHGLWFALEQHCGADGVSRRTLNSIGFSSTDCSEEYLSLVGFYQLCHSKLGDLSDDQFEGKIVELRANALQLESSQQVLTL